jgi:16S rRNA (adenine1518-N6/adenine1519-N6)-dimethyltransferase
MHVKSLLHKYGITPRKRWSQYFLISRSVIQVMASYAQGVVLEIGPGLGFITQELAKKADKVFAIEKDRNMVKILNNEYEFDNVEIIEGDITLTDLRDIPFDRVISNIPYHISSQITFQLLDCDFELGILSYQKEFAERLVLVPPSPEASRLSVMAQMKARWEILQGVPRGNYYPVPKTDCALVKVVPCEKGLTDSFFDAIVRGLYSHKRKTVRNALISSRDLTGICKENIQSTKIPFAEKRVWSLTLEELSHLVSQLRTFVSEWE